MSLFTLLDALLIGPLKLLFEFIFLLANRFLHHPGLAIIALSLVMNILVLPLYRRADAMQEESRDVEARLAPGANHIKKVFSGDERMMILQTYYRQNHYKPTDALKGSVSLLLEIPFFMAAYQFLSSVPLLDGTSLGPIANLGAPDSLIVIGGLSINLLPILMTLINVISSAIYLKGFPLKTKIQLYGMAMFFLVFLYTSPSGLVFYWTLNNLFSLVKTIFYKLKDAKKTGCILLFGLGIVMTVFGIGFYRPDSLKKQIFIIGVGFMMLLPLALYLLKGKIRLPDFRGSAKPNRAFYLLGCLFLTVLVGMLIPSAFLAASPQEYIDRSFFFNPLLYILQTACMAAGTFLVWMQVFYWLADPFGKSLFDKGVWILCGIMLVNYMFFGTDLGVISPNLQYENGLNFTAVQELTNLLVLAGCAAVLTLIICKWPRKLTAVLLTAVIAIGGMSVLNMMTIRKSVDNYLSREPAAVEDAPHFQLSKTGRNVVVIMLDRALGALPPYLFNEKPELQEQFAGFTYYDNVISHGGYTLFGTPALVGGYEYTPVEMNKRDTELLVDKHNEALKVMPVLFSENGYDTTVFDPFYANYQWIPDLAVYDEYPDIKAYLTEGHFTSEMNKEAEVDTRLRNFFCLSLMKTMPLILQPTLYQDGNYNQATPSYSVQRMSSASVADGISNAFLNGYSVLTNMAAMTEITQEENGAFLMMFNNATHEPALLQTPEYIPAEHVDNRDYDAAHADRFTVNGRTINIRSDFEMIHYHANMAAFLQLGNWFDYLRENDVYDNTRIIIVSDHGRDLGLYDEMVMDSTDDTKDVGFYFPLLMVKDFGSTEFTTSSEFMTNADVPVLATQGLMENPVNPFTGKVLSSDEKTAHPQFIIRSHEWTTESNNGTAFLPARWASVEGSIWDRDNWSFHDDVRVLASHSFS